MTDASGPLTKDEVAASLHEPGADTKVSKICSWIFFCFLVCFLLSLFSLGTRIRKVLYGKWFSLKIKKNSISDLSKVDNTVWKQNGV